MESAKYKTNKNLTMLFDFMYKHLECNKAGKQDFINTLIDENPNI